MWRPTSMLVVCRLSGKCPDGWTPFQSSCYLRSHTRRNWEDSRSFCQGHEADLVVVSDITKQVTMAWPPYLSLHYLSLPYLSLPYKRLM